MTAQDRVEAAERDRHDRDRHRDAARTPAVESMATAPVHEEEKPAVGRGAHDAAAVTVHAAAATGAAGPPPLDAVARWSARTDPDRDATTRGDDPSGSRASRAPRERTGGAATSARTEARRARPGAAAVRPTVPAAAALTVTSHGDSREVAARRTAELAGQSGRGPPAAHEPHSHSGRDPPSVAPAAAPPRTLAAARADTDRVPSDVRSVVRAPGAGRPVSDSVRDQVEPLVGADLSAVRVHTDRRAADAAASLGARAFTVGSDIYLGAGQSSTDVRLMAHELTHTVQQSRASPDTVFRDGDATSLIPDAVLDSIAAQADSIPGYALMTQLVEYDPIRGRHVERSSEGVVRGLFGLVPFGVQIYDRLAASDLVQRAMTLVTDGLTAHRLTLARLRHEVDAAWAEIHVVDGITANIAVVARHVDGIVTDVRAFATSLVDQVIALVREVAVGMLEHLLEGPTVGPAWTLAKKVMHHDPLRDVDVVASTEEILADLLTLLGQGDRLAQLRERGVITQVATWIDENLGRFQGLVAELGMLFHEAWNAIAPANLADLPHNLEQLVAHAGDLLGRVRSFGEELIAQALSLVKDSLLHWLSEHAHQTRGFRLVTVLIGQDPFTHEAVPPTPENLIGGFISLLPNGEATFAQLSESGVIADASARITTAAAELGITSQLVRDTFLGIWGSLHLEDLLHPIDTFVRIVDAFGDPVRRIIAFVATVVQVVIELVLRLMNFPSDLLASIIEHVTSAIAAIREDPVRFLMNMLEALKRGILSFVDHIATHLLDGLASWLFRGLGQLGIQRPPDLSLQSIITLVLQVLGLSMDLVWAKLEERLGAETVGRIRGALDMLSGAWGFIKDVQERGITAIWEFISGQLSNLWDTIISAAQAWIQDRIVSAVVEKLVSMLDPTGVMAVVNSFLAFFRAVQSLIDYIREVLELVNEYVTTLDEVAHGNVDPAAAKVENGLAMATPMAIGFLANQVGIGNIPEKIVEIITSVRGVVEQAVAWLIDQAITLGQSALAALGVGGGAGHPEQAAASTGAGSGWLYEVPDHGHTIRVSHGFEVFRFSEPELLPPIDAHAKVQAILESMVPRIAVTYPTDGQRRAIGPSGHVTGCKDGEGRSSMPPVPNLPGGAAAYEAGDVRGHLVGDRFYGTAVDGNLVPMHTTLNGSTFLAFETQQANRYRRAVADGHGALLHWTVTPNYPTSGNVFRPVSITATATLITLQPNGASLAPTQVPITTTLSNPASAAGPVDLNTADRTTLLAMWQGQISTDHHDLVDAIIASRPIRDEVAFTFDLAQRAGVHRAPRFEHLLASRIGRMVR